MTFALNHLGYYLLTNLLLDVLISSAPSRVINVSSAAHLGAEIDFEDIQNSKKYSGLRAYGRSKLANLMFTYALARRLEGTGVTANALHPGLVATNLPANGKMLFGWVIGPILRSFLTIAGKSKAKGCQTVVYLATAREVANITGRYLVDESETKSSDASNDTEAADRLWELSSQLTGFSSSNKRTGGG